MNDQIKHKTAVGASGIRNIVMGICGILAALDIIPESDIDTIALFAIMIITPLISMYKKDKALKAEPPKVK